MQREEFILIAAKVSEGTASQQEKELFLYHINTFIDQNPEWENLTQDIKQNIEAELRADIDTQINGEDAPEINQVKKLWPRIAAAAAILLVIGAGLFYYTQQNKTVVQNQVVFQNDITPGKQGATLTLANGKQIKLSDASNGELAKEAGVVITKTANGQLVYEIKNPSAETNKINTISTAKGETYQVRLPDGTLVWLNAASSLTYAATLDEGGVRRAKLEGEAYFEVAKDKAHSFVVQSKGQEIEVLGTHFNINSYQDEGSTKTTLLEGSVRVTPGNGRAAILKPNQQAILKGGSLEVTAANIEEAVSWKNGYFRFNDEKIETIMARLARWYDIEVVYEGKMQTDGFTGTASRNKNISQVLKLLENTKGIHFRIEGRRVTVIR